MKLEPVENGTLPEVYDSKYILANRRKTLQTWCQKQQYSKEIQYITGYISRYGRSTGNVDFWTCFTPKCASQSFTTAVLHATGFIKPNQDLDNKPWRLIWLNEFGRNKCPRENGTCLHEYEQMPTSLRTFKSPLVKGLFARDPMDRLVSAWKNKLYAMNFQFYYEKVTYKILRIQDPRVPVDGKTAFEQGYRLEFNDFIKWLITDFNFNADEHWRPIHDLCNVCYINYDFIGHSDYFNEELPEFFSLLNVSTSILPPSFETVNRHSAENNKYINSTSIEEYFSDVSKNERKLLLQIYQPDYDAFSFTVPKWLI